MRLRGVIELQSLTVESLTSPAGSSDQIAGASGQKVAADTQMSATAR